MSAKRLQFDHYTKDVEITDDANNSSPINNMVYYVPPPGGVYGIPIMIKGAGDKKTPIRKSTVGVFVYVGDQLFGFTVAQAFRTPCKMI